MPRTVTHKPDSPNNDDVLAASEKWDACKPPIPAHTLKSVLLPPKLSSPLLASPAVPNTKKKIISVLILVKQVR